MNRLYSLTLILLTVVSHTAIADIRLNLRGSVDLGNNIHLTISSPHRYYHNIQRYNRHDNTRQYVAYRGDSGGTYRAKPHHYRPGQKKSYQRYQQGIGRKNYDIHRPHRNTPRAAPRYRGDQPVKRHLIQKNTQQRNYHRGYRPHQPRSYRHSAPRYRIHRY